MCFQIVSSLFRLIYLLFIRAYLGFSYNSKNFLSHIIKIFHHQFSIEFSLLSHVSFCLVSSFLHTVSFDFFFGKVSLSFSTRFTSLTTQLQCAVEVGGKIKVSYWVSHQIHHNFISIFTRFLFSIFSVFSISSDKFPCISHSHNNWKKKISFLSLIINLWINIWLFIAFFPSS